MANLIHSGKNLNHDKGSFVGRAYKPSRRTALAAALYTRAASLRGILPAAMRFAAALLAFALATFPQTVRAGGLAESSLAKGTEQLLQDATSWLMVIVPAVTVLVVIYYLIRRAAADEMEHKKWNSRIMAAIISCIIAVAVSALLNALTSYFAA